VAKRTLTRVAESGSAEKSQQVWGGCDSPSAENVFRIRDRGAGGGRGTENKPSLAKALMLPKGPINGCGPRIWCRQGMAGATVSVLPSGTKRAEVATNGL
jgi:hypothetical protein